MKEEFCLEQYPRFKKAVWKPFDIRWVTECTKRLVCKSAGGVELRKYTDFYVAGVYRGIATACVVGCNLRCIFCWSPLSRDFPELYGEYYSPRDVVEKLEELCRRYGIRKARISCGEPTICWDHLLGVLDLVEESKYIDLFILETNGISMALNPERVYELKKYRKVYTRISVKAGTPQGFEFRTGAEGSALELQFEAIRLAKKAGLRFHVAAMTDPRLMQHTERSELVKKLWSIDPVLALSLEEEVVDPYRATIIRLREAGVNLRW